MNLWPPRSAGLVTLCFIGLCMLSTAREAYHGRWWFDRTGYKWLEMEQVARVVNEVTPADAPFYAEADGVYVVARREPVAGFEDQWSLLRLPPEKASLALLASSDDLELLYDVDVFRRRVRFQQPQNRTARHKDGYSDSLQVGAFTIFWNAGSNKP